MQKAGKTVNKITFCRLCSKNNGLKILNIDYTVDKKEYFTHDIEPSASGSSVITDNILNL